MKTGTQGWKVGPMKVLTGTHADGAPLKLKVLVGPQHPSPSPSPLLWLHHHHDFLHAQAMSTANRRIVAKCSFDELAPGDADAFMDTLVGRNDLLTGKVLCPDGQKAWGQPLVLHAPDTGR